MFISEIPDLVQCPDDIVTCARFFRTDWYFDTQETCGILFIVKKLVNKC